MLRGPYTLVRCKLYKCVAVVTCLALTWVRGRTITINWKLIKRKRNKKEKRESWKYVDDATTGDVAQ